MAGGVGGAKLIDGLSSVLFPDELSVIVNTGDDFVHCGLKISPDLDTVCYTLAGLANAVTGWGIADDTYTALSDIIKINGPDWFKLGDMDMGTQVFKAIRQRAGFPLSRITSELCDVFQIKNDIFPMSDDETPTIVTTKEYGDLNFQDYFVYRHCEPTVLGFRYQGHENACALPAAISGLKNADLIILCPSNPWVSLDPILSIPGYRSLLKSKKVIGISPIIAGRSIKGPAAKMFAELGMNPSAVTVAKHYRDILNGFMLDLTDAALSTSIGELFIVPRITGINMKSADDRKRLAEEVLSFSSTLPAGE